MDMNLGLADLVARLEEAIGKKMMNVVFWVFVIWVLATLVWNTLKVILDISDTASEWGPWGQIAYTVVLYAAVLVVSWGWVDGWLIAKSGESRNSVSSYRTRSRKTLPRRGPRSTKTVRISKKDIRDGSLPTANLKPWFSISKKPPAGKSA